MGDITIRKARLEDLDAIYLCESTCFVEAWSYSMLYDDIIENPNTRYLVVQKGDRVVGYGGMWIVLDEAHITNVCILPEYRGNGYAYALMQALQEEAIANEASSMTLEVRVSNKNALKLYKKCGFSIHGLRKRYYPNNGEDAYVMWTEHGMAQ